MERTFYSSRFAYTSRRDVNGIWFFTDSAVFLHQLVYSLSESEATSASSLSTITSSFSDVSLYVCLL